MRELIQSDDQADTLVDLGSQLEAQGFEREAIEVYRRLPSRAPSNAEYCDNFVRACDRSWEVGPCIPYIERLFDPLTDPVFKPLNFPFERLREIHARFVGLLNDVAQLRALAYPATPVRVKQGRIPEEVPYLKELGVKLGERGDLPGALAAWEQIHQIWKHDGASWRIDPEVLFQRATALTRQGNTERALEAWREIVAQPEWSDAMHKALTPYAELAAETGRWAEVREVMNVTTGLSAISVADVLARHGRPVKAQSLLIRVERATHDSTGRFRLRLAQLQLASQDPQWSPLKAEDRLNVCLTTDTDDADSLDALVTWLRKEAAGPRGAAWVESLRARAPLNDLRAVALSAFAALLQPGDMALLEEPWPREKDPTHAAQLLVVRTLLEQNLAAEAWRVAQSGAYSAVVHSPDMLRVLAALGDTHALEDEFSRLVRLSFPGGANGVACAEALAEGGRADWAAELYRLALERSRAIGQPTLKLVPSYTTFLIHQRRFEEAETLLLQEGPGMTQELAQLLVNLYQAWGKLPRFEEELRKFDLPDGVAAQARFLASQIARS